MSATDSSSWHPDESSEALYIERTCFVAVPVVAAFYGIHVLLCFNLVRKITSRMTLRGQPWWTIVYVMVMLILSSCYFGASLKWTQQMYIDDRNYPGGPIGFYTEQYWVPLSVFSCSAFVIENFLADALVLYRCWIVWNRSWAIIIVPALTLLCSTALSCVAVYQVSEPGRAFFFNSTLQFMLPYFCMSVGLNILLTLMIAARLLLARRRLKAVLGNDHADIYTSITAMLVESASLYSACSIAFIITYTRNDSLFNVFLPLQSQIMCISPLLILLRVAEGRAFSTTVCSTLPEIAFRVTGPTPINGMGTTLNPTETALARGDSHGTELKSGVEEATSEPKSI